jgi:hypothetical protein
MDVSLALASFAALVLAWTVTARRRTPLHAVDDAERDAA